MAKIFKVSGYIVAPNAEDYDTTDRLETELNFAAEDFSYPSFWRHLKIEEADVEWSNNIPLNFRNCKVSDCEKYFDREKEK